MILEDYSIEVCVEARGGCNSGEQRGGAYGEGLQKAPDAAGCAARMDLLSADVSVDPLRMYGVDHACGVSAGLYREIHVQPLIS